MSRSEIMDAAMLASIVGITVSLLMMIGSTVYLNKSKCRFRFFELGYSKGSDWYKSGKVDFFTANMMMSNATVAAIILKNAQPLGKMRKNGSVAAPFIHIDNNYEKMCKEFPWFIRWEISKIIITTQSMITGTFAAGLFKGWW